MRKILITILITTALSVTGCSISNPLKSKDITSNEEISNNTETIKEKKIITFKYDEAPRSITADDGQDILQFSISYPVFSGGENEGALNKINESIQSYLRTFNENMDKNFDYLSGDDVDLAIMRLPQGAYLEMTVKRCDKNIISLEICESVYSGGVHSSEAYCGMTFDATTGEKLSLNSISDNYTNLYSEAFNYIKKIGSQPAYAKSLSQSPGSELEKYLLKAEDKWYLSNSGLVFMSNPYELASYGNGSLRFVVPYDKITNLKSQYKYEGEFNLYSRVSYDVEADINGDGTEDNIFLDYKYDSAQGKLAANLEINSKDYSNKLAELAADEGYKGQYYLVDLNKDDNFKEIAIEIGKADEYKSYGNNNNLNNFTGKTYFYRLNESSELECLGYIDKLISDVTVDYLNEKLK